MLQNVAAFTILESTPAVLRSILAAATPEQLTWIPAPGRWSIAMVLAHLADVEVNGFVHRFRAMVEQDSPFLASYNQLALFDQPQNFDARERLEKFTSERTCTLSWLKTLPDGLLHRTGRHEELGPISAGDLLHEFAFHDLGHIRQIAEVYRSCAFYPNMGGFRSYYRISP